MSTFDEDEEEFGAPSNNLGPTWKNSKGVLFAIKGIEQVFGVKTDFGDADPVRARIVEVDGPNAGTVYEEALVFPKALAGSLRPYGKVVVGRLDQGEAKKGQDPPWILTEATAEDMTRARAAWSASKNGAPKVSTSKADSPY